MALGDAIPNAVFPTPGQGLVLGLDGKIPILQPWMTGDYKISAIAADHADPGGGMWLLCNASAIDTKYAGLITLVGVNRPDARGRTLVMKGTNAAVNTLLASDGVAVGNRRGGLHGTSNNATLPDHVHNPDYHGATAGGPGLGAGQAPHNDQGDGSPTGSTGNPTTHPALGGSIGTNVATDPLDTPAFLVPGNLFIHT